VHLGTFNGVQLTSAAGGFQTGQSTARKHGNTYTIAGMATGFGALSGGLITKRFEMDVVCP
jgi:hypothetical protein